LALRIESFKQIQCSPKLIEGYQDRDAEKYLKKVLIFVLVIFCATVSPVCTAVATNLGTAHPNLIQVSVTPSAVTCSPSGLCPSMVLKAYDFSSLITSGSNGTGQTVVIVDACGSPTISSDLRSFDKKFGLPNPTLNVIDVQGSPCTNANWAIETSLDVEWSHVMAPGANIELLVAATPSSTNLYGTWSYSLTNNLGNQISNSWGGSSACGSTPKGLLKTATTDHVTVLASAGDSGNWGTGTPRVAQSPADCTDVLTVGGTTLTVDSTGTYLSEAAWSGSGGGFVTGTSEPKYQTKVLIADPYSLLGKPDVAAVASPATGVWVRFGGSWYVVGGTSVACPLWAGFMADVNQIRASNGLSSAGSVNSFLYSHVYGVSGGAASYPTDFHDVKTGSNGWPAGTGWDPATGLGSFDADNLAQTLGTASAAVLNSTT
jgi:subtilase family serine protease